MIYEAVLSGPSWYLEGREADLDLTWRDFLHDCGQGQSKRDSLNIFTWKYRNKVLQWEGQVLRVDGDSTEDYENLDVKDSIWAPDSQWHST